MEDGQFKVIDVIEEMCTARGIGFGAMRVARDIMNTDFKTLTLDHSVRQCLRFMEGRRVRHVPVVDLPYEGEKRPYFIGVVSQRDVLRLGAEDGEEGDRQKTDRRALRQLLVQIVARKPKSVLLETPAEDVIRVMTGHHIDMVPVLDGADLAGIITTADLLKLLFRLDKAVHELKKGASGVDRTAEGSGGADILFSWSMRAVKEIMTEEVVCLGPEEELGRAVEVMEAEEFRHLPITDEEGRFVGVVSDRDVLRNLPFAGRRPPTPPKRFREHLFRRDRRTRSLQLALESVMVRNVLHVLPSCSVSDAADILYRKKISCLPVVDEQGRLRGIITVTDLMRALLGAYEPHEKAGLIASESSIC